MLLLHLKHIIYIYIYAFFFVDYIYSDEPLDSKGSGTEGFMHHLGSQSNMEASDV